MGEGYAMAEEVDWDHKSGAERIQFKGRDSTRTLVERTHRLSEHTGSVGMVGRNQGYAI